MEQRVLYSLGLIVVFVMVMCTDSSTPLPNADLIASDELFDMFAKESAYSNVLVFMFFKDNCPRCEPVYPIYSKVAREYNKEHEATPLVSFFIVNNTATPKTAKNFENFDLPFYVLYKYHETKRVMNGDDQSKESLSEAISDVVRDI